MFQISFLSMFSFICERLKWFQIDCSDIKKKFLYDFSISDIYEYLIKVNIFFWIINEILSAKIILTQESRFEDSDFWLNFVECNENKFAKKIKEMMQ